MPSIENAVRMRKLVFLPRFNALGRLSKYSHTAKWNRFVLFIVLALVIQHKSRNVFQNLCSDDLCMQNFTGPCIISASALESKTPLDESRHAFYFVCCINMILFIKHFVWLNRDRLSTNNPAATKYGQ